MFSLSLRRQLTRLPPIIKKSYSESFSDRERWSNLDDEEKARVKKARKLKKWRIGLQPQETYLSAFDFAITRKNIFSNKGSLDPRDWRDWYERKQMEHLRCIYRYQMEREKILGKDLALAQFLLHRSGKVRQKGTTVWLSGDDIDDVPCSYKPDWFIEEIDVTGTRICYEGLEHFKDVRRLKKATFRNCANFDDWCLERLVCYCPNLEVLDISENQKITERGLEGLYRAWNLKKLIVTDWGHGPAFELACLMLEDCLPDLTIIIKKVGDKSDALNKSDLEDNVAIENFDVKKEPDVSKN